MAETKTRPEKRASANGSGDAVELDRFSREQLHHFMREMLLYRRFE